MTSPLLSVCLITYNHENYIKQAIDGILMQQVDFNWELIIAEDCSTDGTREILLEYKEKYPDFIKLILQEKNVGPAKNFLDLIQTPKSKYIAYCEGDDYWTDPLKIQKQVDILELNENIGLVCSKVKHYNQTSGDFIEITPTFVKASNDVIALMLKSKFISLSASIFRASVLFKVIDAIRVELETGIIGDTRILLETVYQSEVYFLNEVTAVYRILEGSASHPNEVNKYILAIKDSYLCRKEFVVRNNLNKKWLSDSICNTNRGLINQAFVAKKYSDSMKFLGSILIIDTLKYCRFNVFVKKIKLDIWMKLMLSLVGIGLLRQKLKKSN
ncbi:glycosyltransferase involved in cell wall biosynthesis [Flavobacterium sp. CG_23.5]|uniref:glycosyltransferase n=1 Tax=Flavobacterium sp. CG_23.5 TaxID=2760708 RepID=UPI001AE918B0|nr:glycosyltransferase [Flavobacterium sp. CG_23.5]MBP2283049.1 glycosyltransferase involved in cell wall biosynthesis [Flavobacterium sp. CG_23.5]